jgi:hypothetical protein
MIGGNSRNAGKTTLACKIISKLSQSHEVIGLKVTSIRPGEENLHGDHSEDELADFEIHEEIDPASHKDTSLMLRAGASRVYYIRTSTECSEVAVKEFFKLHVSDQAVICESRSLRDFIIPGIFIMMLRIPAEGKKKEIENYLSMADKVFTFEDISPDYNNFIDNLSYDINIEKFLTQCK